MKFIIHSYLFYHAVLTHPGLKYSKMGTLYITYMYIQWLRIKSYIDLNRWCYKIYRSNNTVTLRAVLRFSQYNLFKTLLDP